MAGDEYSESFVGVEGVAGKVGRDYELLDDAVGEREVGRVDADRVADARRRRSRCRAGGGAVGGLLLLLQGFRTALHPLLEDRCHHADLDLNAVRVVVRQTVDVCVLRVDEGDDGGAIRAVLDQDLDVAADEGVVRLQRRGARRGAPLRPVGGEVMEVGLLAVQGDDEALHLIWRRPRVGRRGGIEEPLFVDFEVGLCVLLFVEDVEGAVQSGLRRVLVQNAYTPLALRRLGGRVGLG